VAVPINTETNVTRMELNSEVPTLPPRDAATVVMLRDGTQGLEVFLVKRHGLSDVLGGAYVFPGGKLDAADCDIGHHHHFDRSPALLHSALAESETDLATACGLFVAALRETFEESGVLFAKPAGASTGSAPQDFHARLAAQQLHLHTSAVQPWTRWITPRMPSVTNKRFDTRFFIAAMPHGQLAAHDNVEATESAWLPPRTALQHYWERKIELAPPQIMSLAQLSRHATVASALAEASSRPPPVIMPEAFNENGERVICYPGDSQHSVALRAMPGPSRLFWRNKRFEPEGGFEALFD
jgi:8-oxo-dGTP pyrophosphatase MutT (NUDIX family)